VGLQVVIKGCGVEGYIGLVCRVVASVGYIEDL